MRETAPNDTSRVRLDLEGPAAPPRSNGELVFAAPWEGRLFGVTVALHAAGRFEWDQFRRLLIDEIGRADRDEGVDATQRSYYACWHRALERLLDDTALCDCEEIAERSREIAGRPAGHDHRPQLSRHGAAEGDDR